MSTRPHTPRALTATVLALFTLLALTGCNDGQGVRDEGPATARAATPEHHKAARH